MGLDIVAISKAKWVPCRGGADCSDSHHEVSTYRKNKDRLKAGCYVVEKGGRSFGFRAASYFNYDLFRQELSMMALGVDSEEVWGNPRHFRRKPFVELIDFPDGVGPVIGPKTSAKLFDDFAEFASKAKRHFLSGALSEEAAAKQKRRKRTQKNQMNCAGLVSTAKLVRKMGIVPVKSEDGADLDWMWEVYRDFRRAFKLASDRGFVQFC
jgi:hypothetical protein